MRTGSHKRTSEFQSPFLKDQAFIVGSEVRKIDGLKPDSISKNIYKQAQVCGDEIELIEEEPFEAEKVQVGKL